MFSIGAWVGTVVTFAGSGVLCESGFDNGWGSIFYITGISVMHFCYGNLHTHTHTHTKRKIIN